MTKSANSDPEIKQLLKCLKDLGYPIKLPKAWGVKRAKKDLKIVISAVTPGICPVCGRRVK